MRYFALTVTSVLMLILLSPSYVHANTIPASAKLDKLVSMSFCIFDPIGKYGEAYSRAQDMALEARNWNLQVDLKLYTDERIAAEDFKAGRCDGTVLSTLRARQFNKFMGSIDSVGSIPSEKHMKVVLKMLTNPKIQPYTITGPFQVVGIIPLGSAYVFVNDKSINSVEAAAGKKVAILEWDKSQADMVSLMGAAPVSADITSFAGKFNNHQVDIIVAPALIYKPFELYKGLGDKGGVFNFPVAYVTGSIVINRDKLLEKIPDLDQRLNMMREWGLSQVDEAFELIKKSEADIDEKYWMELSDTDKKKYRQMMRETRILLTKKGYYDPKMMALLKRVRCKLEPSNAECSMSDE